MPHGSQLCSGQSQGWKLKRLSLLCRRGCTLCKRGLASSRPPQRRASASSSDSTGAVACYLRGLPHFHNAALCRRVHTSVPYSSYFGFIWAWDFRSKCRQTNLLILADPPRPAKYAFCIRCSSSGLAFCSPNDFTGVMFASRMNLRDTVFTLWVFPQVKLLYPIARRPQLGRLFFRTGFACALRTSNCSNHIEITRVVRRKNVCWPRVPLLA